MDEQPLPFTVLLSQKTKDLTGIPLLGGQFDCSPFRGGQNTPRGGADGKNN